MSTKILTTHKNGRGKSKKGKGSSKQLNRKVQRKHKGYGMKRIVKSALTFKGKGRKR